MTDLKVFSFYEVTDYEDEGPVYDNVFVAAKDRDTAFEYLKACFDEEFETDAWNYHGGSQIKDPELEAFKNLIDQDLLSGVYLKDDEIYSMIWKQGDEDLDMEIN